MVPFERIQAIALALPEVDRPLRNSPAVLTRLSAQTEDDVPELADLIEDAWRRCAPKSLSRAHPPGERPPDRG